MRKRFSDLFDIPSSMQESVPVQTMTNGSIPESDHCIDFLLRLLVWKRIRRG